MRRKIVAGNWKMNKTTTEAITLTKLLKDKCNSEDVDVVFCVPAINIIPVMNELKGTNIEVGCQNIHFEDSGAYTGEISADMLVDLGIKYTIVGHSERREYFGETDVIVNKKVVKSIEKGLVPIICVGEKLEEREQGVTFDLVRLQTKVALLNVSKEDAKKVVIAYEPIWAIGTGKTASNEQAEEVCKAIREVLAEIYDEPTAQAIRIQYGGSVNGGNAKDLFTMENIDGGLVGGASLKEEFENIVKA